MKYKAFFSPQAKEDVRAIQMYLRQFSGQAPARFKNTMRDKLEKVKENPYLYEAYRYQPRYRCMLLEKYLLFYEVNEEQEVIYVFRILHGAQDTPHYL